MRDGCVFCDYEGPNDVLRERTVTVYDPLGEPTKRDFFVIEPLGPVTPGHFLVIPREHAEDFRLAPLLLAGAMEVAADLAADLAADEIVDGEPKPGCNLIVSAGAEATQTVKHLHVHVVPRRDRDGICLPWWCASSQGAWRA